MSADADLRMGIESLWLVPAAYALHMVEEAPRFVAWTGRYRRLFWSRFTTRVFWLGNAVTVWSVLVGFMPFLNAMRLARAERAT